MSEKTLNNIRIVHKHDTEENWLKATNFIPKQGELIIYDVDTEHNYERFKIGDGINLVNDLPFGSIQSDWNQSDETASDYIKNRTHYTETSIISETRTVKELVDEKFAQLLLENRQTAQYIIFGGNELLVYNRELINDDDTIGWSVIGENFREIAIHVSKNSANREMKDKIYIYGETLEITINTINEMVHQLDEKFIPDTIARVENIPEQVQADWN